MSNVLTTPGVLTLDTAAVLSTTAKYKLGIIVFAAKSDTASTVTLEDGAGNLVLTLRAAAGNSFAFDAQGKEFTGLEVASITSGSNLTIFSA